jgi:hypothetical protein
MTVFMGMGRIITKSMTPFETKSACSGATLGRALFLLDQIKLDGFRLNCEFHTSYDKVFYHENTKVKMHGTFT